MVAIKGAKKASVGLTVLNDKEVQDLFKKLDTQVRYTVCDKAMRSAARPVLTKMLMLVPDSRSTNSRKLQSQRTRQRWSGSKPLHTTIMTVVRRFRTGAKAIVGPSWSDGGGHGNLFSKDHARAVYWGRDAVQASKRSRTVNQFVKRSADEASGAAKSAAIRVIKEYLDNPQGSGLLK
jgi:hypothetical protein